MLFTVYIGCGMQCACERTAHTVFLGKPEGLSVDRGWDRGCGPVSCGSGTGGGLLWSHKTGRFHKIVSTTRATVNLSRTSCHMVGLYVQKIQYFIVSAVNLVKCVVWNSSFQICDSHSSKDVCWPPLVPIKATQHNTAGQVTDLKPKYVFVKTVWKGNVNLYIKPTVV